MPSPKGITIKLTDKQRAQIKAATGADHSELRVERSPGAKGRVRTPLSSKVALRTSGGKGPLLP